MATALKKPKTPVAKAPPPAKKAPPVAAKAPKAKWTPAVGDHVQFTGYPAGDERGNPVFEVGQVVIVADVREDEDRGQYFVVVADEATLEAYKRKEDVDGDELAIGEITQVKAPAVPKEAPPDPHDVLEYRDDDKLREMLAEGDPIDTALRVYNDIQKQFYYLGGLLAHVYKERKYVERGYPDEGQVTNSGWEKFCNEVYGFSGRKGFELIQVFSRFSMLENLDQEKLARVGSSKAVAMARYINQENVDELLDRAFNTPILELRKVLVNEYTDTSGKTPTGQSAQRQRTGPTKLTLKYEVYEAQAEQIEMVINEARKDMGKATDGEILEHILTEWANEHLHGEAKKKFDKVVAKAGKTTRPLTKPKPVAA
jgi:hypothetical protein